jgi:enoyl-CoA hydratase
MPHPNLPVTYQDGIATVSFDRPERRNAFNLSMWLGLREVMEALSADDALRCVVLRGAGTTAFSAGADLREFPAERGTPEREDRYGAAFHRGMQAIRECRHPVVAMVLGHCLGGGAGIATMCDFRVGGEGIRFGVTARSIGLFYPYAEIDPVVQMVGTGVAAEIFIEGRIFDGREAYAKGLLSRVVPDDAVEAEAMALARRIADGAPLAARFHKAAIRKLRGPLPIGQAEYLDTGRFAETEDFRDAVAAFLAKRTPSFRGR